MKMDEFLDKFQTTSAPPPIIYGKICGKLFIHSLHSLQKIDGTIYGSTYASRYEGKVVMKYMHMIREEDYSEGQVFGSKAFPFETFPKIHLFWYRHPSLRLP